MKKRDIPQAIMFGIFRVCTVMSVSLLLIVLILLLRSGLSVIDWQFLTVSWQHRDITKGGIMQAIVGSFLVGIGVMAVSFPLGIATAIYLTEYSGHSVFRRIIQLAIRNLAGVPSVVYGLFGLAIFVHVLDFGMSLLSAILTLSIMTLPWIITASVEALETVPQTFRDSSLAVGATPWQTIWHVVLPSAVPGSITGGVIGIARAMGETAPLILVGATFFLSGLPHSPFDKFMALPYHTFILATQHSSPRAVDYASGSAIILLCLTFVLSLTAILIRSHFRRQKDW